MKCNTNCLLMEKGKSIAVLYVKDVAYKHCVYRHKQALKRGEYDRSVLIGGDITSTWCYKGKIVRAVKPRENKYTEAMVI